MPPDFSVIEGAYLRDILDQPRALEETLAGLDLSDALHRLARRLQEGEFQTVVLTGMGSSFYALHPLNLGLIHHGFTSMMVETSELLHYQNRLFDPKTLIVAVSQSGQSAEAVRLLEMNRGKSPVIAVTNTPGKSPSRTSRRDPLHKSGRGVFGFLQDLSCRTDGAAMDGGCSLPARFATHSAGT